MVNSVAQQVAIINNLIGQALTTYLGILAYSFYRSYDVFGKRWFRVFPPIRKHNPMTIGSIRKSLMNSQIREKFNRRNRNRVLLASRTPLCTELFSTPCGHVDSSDAFATGAANPILPYNQNLNYYSNSSSSCDASANSPSYPCSSISSCDASANSPSFPCNSDSDAHAITFGGAATPPHGHAASTGTHYNNNYNSSQSSVV